MDRDEILPRISTNARHEIRSLIASVISKLSEEEASFALEMCTYHYAERAFVQAMAWDIDKIQNRAKLSHLSKSDAQERVLRVATVILGDLRGVSEANARLLIAKGIASAYLGCGTDAAAVEAEWDLLESWGFGRP